MEKLKFIFISLYLSLYGAPEVEVSIEHALTTVHGNQTIVVVNYAGSDQIQYVKNVSEDKVLTIDFPGVFSQVDFEELQIAQVESIEQLPLNPDANQGISLRMKLRDTVSFEIYESDAREITFIFEGLVAVEPEQMLAEAEPQEDTLELSIPFEGSSAALSKLEIQALANGGMIIADRANAALNTFELIEPARFVVDFKDTVLTHQQNDYELQHGPVNRIRIRQFKNDPKPVTRMVMDLNEAIVTEVINRENGVIIVFSTNDSGLTSIKTAVLGSNDQNDMSSPALSIASSELEEVETTSPESSASSYEQLASFERVVQESTTRDQMTQKSWTLSEHIAIAETMDEKPSVTEVISGSHGANEGVEEVVVADFSKASSIDQKAAISQEWTSIPVQEKLTKQTSQPLSVKQKIEEVTAETPMEETLVFSEDKPQVEHAEPLVTKSEVVSIDEKPVASEPNDLLGQIVSGEAGIEDEPKVVETKNAAQPSEFEMAQDIDLELGEFLGESEDELPLHVVMKDVKRNRNRLNAPLVITNESMQQYAGTRLVEAAAMQNSDEENFESLFSQDQVIDDYETIDGAAQQYNGFEISSINVRSVSVIDLLRFIADLVGINLYVDSSVSEELRATYKFTNLPWDQVLDIILKNAGLEKEFTNGVLRVATLDKFREEAAARAELLRQRELSVPPQTVTFPLSYAKAEEAKPIIESYLSERGRILIDERTNTLIIEDIPKRMVAVRELIRKLDRIIDQVTIEARIVETNKRFLRELGIQWGLGAQYSPELGTDTGVTFPNRVNVGGPARGAQIATGPIDGGYAVNFPIVSENPSGFGLTLGNFLDNFKLDISLQMLETDGHGQIISSPKITTQNNKTAIIKNGSRLPVQTVQRGTVTIVYIDAVLELEVTPHITSEETIIMDLVIDKSEPDFTRTVSGNPVINVRRAETRVLVKNGGTAVIGGIFSLNEQGTSQGLPGVRKVPVLKRLFGSESKSYSNEELLIFITPRIVKY